MITTNLLKKIQGILIIFSVFFLININVASAEVSRPTLDATEWRTGELQICWTDLTTADDFSIMRLWVSSHESNGQYILHESWISSTEEGCHISKYFENGQTLWYYVDVLHALTDEISPRSNIQKQTPPITAFIINWPDMFQDIIDAINQSNNRMEDFLEGLITPSDQAIQDLQDAINNLSNSLGTGSAQNAGNQLGSGLSNIGSNLNQPLNFDDGVGTFTGGANPNELPFNNTNTGDTGNPATSDLNYPDLDDGTMNDFSIRIPFMVDQNGEYKYIKLFTDEQLEKMKWLDAALKIAEAIIYIFDAFYLLSRFAPQLKS